MEAEKKRQMNADKDAEWSQLMEKHHSVILRVCELFYPVGKKYDKNRLTY